jgi:tetratricopeptide (TPR) repeat protein
MFPKLTALQWAVFLSFLFFYGFAVFAVTRDIYLRHPVAAVNDAAAAAGTPHPKAAETAALGQRMQQALDSAESAPVDLESVDVLALGEAADQLFLARRFNASIPIYQRIVELVPEQADARNDLGLALHYSGRTEEGLDVLQAGAEMAPSFQRIWLSLGFVALQTGKLDRAERALNQALAIQSDNDIGQEAARLLGLLNQQSAGAAE